MSTELSDSLKKLSLAQSAKTPAQKKKKPVVADSWEDEELSDDEPVETPDKVPSPPPPTPTTPYPPGHSRDSSSVSSIASPRGPSSPRDSYIETPDSFSRDGSSASSERTVRPRTTDAVARRLIAGALGVKSKSTKEQREYDAAVRAAEKKTRDAEREKKKAEEAERERLRTSIWED
ncbi:uncharacterized protein H6S33_007296 [Morchella sextelata]|uniref:uncharacterized protein n=1 Tax=Morchella sextelata TaxID=1174677 RepID=UPI001D056CB6|nr:uncharacterized protein H6S33_007296 [Morchella sextelata]KAH0603637.1 hypothetical protein H6S33_007296 [Morchella sextelata]